ncbi:hypothetical protein AK830_g7884 [Neonectria ditissima]|uniref:Protein HRI1 n=1 Tax=Neonectria ditissima TaxID=78410 RepID=A0A0P7B962_9HYPO|nr:hypothetical protein AK830_g7884 [Neonectria ditissima]
MQSQALQRVSVRWLPEPAYEDTETVALNVGGFFIDLRVAKDSSTIQWSRAGERIILKEEPLTCRWTHIIDSLDLTIPDEAHFIKLENGDDLEVGTTPCPHKNGAMTAYEEVWRDITAPISSDDQSWILQSSHEATFIGKVGNIYLAIRKGSDGSFAARKEDFEGDWTISFESGHVQELPRVKQVLEEFEVEGSDRAEGRKVKIASTEYVVKALGSN